MNPIFGQRIYDIYCFSGEELSAEEDNNAGNTTDISSHLAKEVFCYSGEETEDKDRNEQDNNQDSDISSIFENYKYCYSGEETENQGRTEHSSASMGSYLIGSRENAEENTFSHNLTSSTNDSYGLNVDDDNDMARVAGETLSSQSPTNQTSKKRSNSSLRTKESSKRQIVFWTEELDNQLLNAIGICGHKWSSVASLVKNKTGKQCRERWCNHLDPRISKEPWSLQEDRLITTQRKRKQEWVEISKKIEELFQRYRTPNSIKNRWNSTKRYESKPLTNQQPSQIPTYTARPFTDRTNSSLLNLPQSPQDSLQDNFG